MTGGPLIRPARGDECEHLTGIALRSKASWGYGEEFMTRCVDELTIEETDLRDHDIFVLEDSGDVVGFCALQARDGGGGELVDVFVEPSHHGRGHGRRLMEHAKRAARARGWRSLLVEADPNAQAFYERFGGKRIGTVASGSIPGRRLPLMEIAL